ncbi:MAG: protein kinase [Planctomycetota bacterium]
MKTQPCNPQRIDAFLEGRLTAMAEQEFETHLSECVSCQQMIETKACRPVAWQEVQEFLADDANAIDSPTIESSSDELPFLVQQVLAQLAPTEHPKSLGRLDGFEVLGVVGFGAMGVVLKAIDPPLDRIVALKVMNPALASSGTARKRFAREAKAAAGVLHPNVIAIHGVSTDYALPYLVMPYLKGISLQQRIDEQGPLEIAEILRIGTQIAAGLAAAHRLGLVHRDIKPANIMLDNGTDTAVITDFGLARTIDDATMTRSGAITGTPEYMSPEQSRGESIESSSDLFSLGSVMYTLCTGRTPFRAPTAFGVLRRINDQTPTAIRRINPSIPDWLCRLIHQLQEKSPSRRPTALQIQQSLEAGLAHINQPDQSPLPSELTRSSSVLRRSNFLPVLTGVISMLVLLSLAIAFALPVNDPSEKEGNEKKSETKTAVVKADAVFRKLELEFPNPKEPGLLVIDIHRGFIDVVSHDKPGVIIEILNPPLPSGKDEEGFRKQFSPDYDLDIKEAQNRISLDTYNYGYTLDLRIKVPNRTNLALDTYYDGYIKVVDVSGRIEAESQNSDIVLDRISGTAKASSYNGVIQVAMKRVDEDAELDFESYNGSIDLELPKDIEATAAFRNASGYFKTMFDLSPVEMENVIDPVVSKRLQVAREKGYQTKTINGGGIPIRIETEKGEIRLRKAD